MNEEDLKIVRKYEQLYVSSIKREAFVYAPQGVELLKPIKTPKRWTRPLISKAILTGQIYRGVITLSYDYEDWIHNAMFNKWKAVEMSLAELHKIAEAFIERDKRFLPSIMNVEMVDNEVKLTLYKINHSYELYFDPKCSKDDQKLRNERLMTDFIDNWEKSKDR